MDDFREFLPNIPGEFNPKLANGGKIARFPPTLANQAGRWDPGTTSWFYRYDANAVEVREIRTCRNAVLAKLHIDELETKEDAGLQITFVTHAKIGTAEYLLIAAQNEEYVHRLWLYNPFNLLCYPIPLAFGDDDKAITAIGVTGACCGNTNQGAGSNRAHHYIMIGTQDRLYITQVYAPPPENPLGKPDVTTEWIYENIPGTVTALAAYVQPNGEKPVIFIGTDRGEVTLYEISETNFTRLLDLSLPDGGGPVTHIAFDGTDGTYRRHGVVFVAQGDTTSGRLVRPVVSVMRVEPNFRRDTLLEGHPEIDGYGTITALSFARDGNGHKVFAAARVRRSRAKATEIHVLGVQEGRTFPICEEDVSRENASAILDLHAFGSCLELEVLYMNKLATYCGMLTNAVMPAVEPETPRFYDLFGSQSLAFPYNNARREDILSRRLRMDDELFFDKLLKSCGLELSQGLYPPTNVEQLEEIFEEISNCQPFLRDSFILYLLKDWENGSDLEYARKAMVQPKYQLAINGYWAFDHGMLQEGLHLLMHPSITQDFPNKVVKTLVMEGRHADALQFMQAVHPPIETMEDIRLHMDVLLRTDFMDAFAFQRKHIDQRDLFMHLLSACFLPKPNVSMVEKLLELPFNSAEEESMVSFCRSADSGAAKDFLIMYYINRGRYSEAISLHDELRSTGQSNRHDVGQLGRDDIIDNVRLLVPEVQRKAQLVSSESRRPAPQSASPMETRDDGREGDGHGASTPLSASKHIRESLDGNTDPQKTLIAALMHHSTQSDAGPVGSADLSSTPTYANQSSDMNVDEPPSTSTAPAEIPESATDPRSPENRPPAALPPAPPALPPMPSSPFIKPPFTPKIDLYRFSRVARPSPLRKVTLPSPDHDVDMDTDFTSADFTSTDFTSSLSGSGSGSGSIFADPSKMPPSDQSPVSQGVETTPLLPDLSELPGKASPTSSIEARASSSSLPVRASPADVPQARTPPAPYSPHSPQHSQARTPPARYSPHSPQHSPSQVATETITTVKSPVGPPSPIGPPLRNLSPFAQAEATTAEVGGQERRGSPAKQASLRAEDDRAQRTTTRRQRGRRAEFDKDLQMGDSVAFDAEQSLASAAKTPRRTRLTVLPDETPADATIACRLRQTPARMNRPGMTPVAGGADHNAENDLPSNKLESRRTRKVGAEKSTPLRQHNEAEVAASRKKATKSAAKTKKPAMRSLRSETPLQDEPEDQPMSLDDLAPATPKTKTKSAGSTPFPRAKSRKAEATPARTIVTRRMAKTLSGEGDLE
ncbi:Protein ELYS [Borealophlyctis nickersoniae]|nr:Protein ELYS [Borealophlyctis nickersoniae]